MQQLKPQIHFRRPQHLKPLFYPQCGLSQNKIVKTIRQGASQQCVVGMILPKNQIVNFAIICKLGYARCKKLVKILCYLIIKTLWTENMKQFEISNSVRKALSNYLNTHNLNLKAAMDNETTNGEVAAIVHAGLPAMIRKIYSLEKMKTFFWTKKDLMMEFINMRLDAGDKKGKN